MGPYLTGKERSGTFERFPLTGEIHCWYVLSVSHSTRYRILIDSIILPRTVLYHMPARQDAAAAKADLARREEELAQLKKKHNIADED